MIAAAGGSSDVESKEIDTVRFFSGVQSGNVWFPFADEFAVSVNFLGTNLAMARPSGHSVWETSSCFVDRGEVYQLAHFFNFRAKSFIV